MNAISLQPPTCHRVQRVTGNGPMKGLAYSYYYSDDLLITFLGEQKSIREVDALYRALSRLTLQEYDDKITLVTIHSGYEARNIKIL